MFDFDLERMKAAVESPTISLPRLLTREERRWYIINVGLREGAIAPPDGLSDEELTEWAKIQYAASLNTLT